MRAVATMIWSAGSRWKVPGSCVDSTAISGESGSSRMPGYPSACCNHWPTGQGSTSRPRSTSLATSQHEMALTPRPCVSCAWR
jgi:hypothetical protein